MSSLDFHWNPGHDFTILTGMQNQQHITSKEQIFLPLQKFLLFSFGVRPLDLLTRYDNERDFTRPCIRLGQRIFLVLTVGNFPKISLLSPTCYQLWQDVHKWWNQTRTSSKHCPSTPKRDSTGNSPPWAQSCVPMELFQRCAARSSDAYHPHARLRRHVRQCLRSMHSQYAQQAKDEVDKMLNTGIIYTIELTSW